MPTPKRAAAATLSDAVTGLDYASRRGAWTDIAVEGAVESSEGSGLEITYHILVREVPNPPRKSSSKGEEIEA